MGCDDRETRRLSEETNRLVEGSNGASKLPVIVSCNGNAKSESVAASSKLGLYEQDGPPDRGCMAWTVCAASFFVNGFIFGTINCYGVMYPALKEKFKDRHNVDVIISLVGSLCIGCTFLMSLMAGILTDRIGIRKTAFAGSCIATLGALLSSQVESPELLYITFGLMVGGGASLAYTPSLVILGHYFKKNLGLVNGIVTAGSSVFTFVLAPVFKVLLDLVGVEKTFLFIAILFAALICCSLVFVPRLPSGGGGEITVVVENGHSVASQPSQKFKSTRARFCNWLAQYVNLDIWQNKRYVIWALAIPVALFGYFVPYIHLVSHVRQILPDKSGEVLVMCIGITSFVGRIAFGFIADRTSIDRILLQQISFACIGCLTMLLSVACDYFVLIAMCLGLGLFDGCFISLLGPIAFDIVGPQGASQAIGFLLALCSLPLTVGPPIAGLIYSYMGDTYNLAFLIAGIPPLVGALVMFTIRRESKQSVPKVSSSSVNNNSRSPFGRRNIEDGLPAEKRPLTASLIMSATAAPSSDDEQPAVANGNVRVSLELDSTMIEITEMGRRGDEPVTSETDRESSAVAPTETSSVDVSAAAFKAESVLRIDWTQLDKLDKESVI